jgi:histidinol-phosphate phosphatase family protein
MAENRTASRVASNPGAPASDAALSGPAGLDAGWDAGGLDTVPFDAVLFDAVLFDRDGTLVVDQPYNTDPGRVTPMPTAVETVRGLRAAGVRVGVVTNQSGAGRGLISAEQLRAVNRAVDDLIGPFDVWEVCTHSPDAGCRCRKPAPGLIRAAAARLGVDPSRTLVIGDIGADLEAAEAAGARSVLVPTAATRSDEVAAAPFVAPDLASAVELAFGSGLDARSRRRVLVARLDSMGDALLSGPAVRAVAASGARVTMLCSPRGAPAARMLPGVADVMVWDSPWISAEAPAVTAEGIRRLVQEVAARRFDEAVILTSFHQSPLPLALLLRLAGLRRIGGASVDHPGSLLDVRLRPGEDLPEDIPESQRALRIAAECGFPLPGADAGLLGVRCATAAQRLPRRYVVLHPGASAPARRWSVSGFAGVASALAHLGVHVVVTGDADERELAGTVAGNTGIDLGGRLTLPELAGVLAGADVVVCGNTGPAHLAAAVGTPVVSLFSPVVPAVRWAPYGVPHIVLGEQDAVCAGSRARTCPVAGHPCLNRVTPAQVVDACLRLAPQLGTATTGDRIDGAGAGCTAQGRTEEDGMDVIANEAVAREAVAP